MGLAALLAGLGAGLVAAGARLAVWAFAPDASRDWAGLFGHPDGRSTAAPAARIAPWIWAGPVAAAVYIGLSAGLTLAVGARFNAPGLVAVLLGALQLLLFAGVAGCATLGARWIAALGVRIGPHRFNPFTRVGPAIVIALIIAVPLAAIALSGMRQIRELVPLRHLLLLALFATNIALLARRPAGGGRRIVIGAVIGAALIGLGLTHPWPAAKGLVLQASPPMSSVIDLVRLATDIDRDGYGSLLGENDCAPLDPAIRPGVRDIPDNGIDENCNGRDFTRDGPKGARQESLPMPARYLRPWNVLLITVDTLRYDHTGFGGYARETTPNLARFAARAVSFDFANAPSAGTMASIPSILVSRFFHSGVALIEHGRGAKLPVSLHESNVLLPEVLKRAGHTTGAVLNHRYFEMGQNQGFDDYDNALAKSGAKGITSPQVTDKALAWVKARDDEPWFLWAHYLDPHGDYVPHAGEPSFGDAPKDLYDGEIRFTDKHLGRLLEGLEAAGHMDDTVIVLTSDHGDGFREHGFINHGMALYRELLHVPLLVYVPGLEPRTVGGAVSPMDILPTLADLIGVDISDLDLEGESLVPQLFYGWDAHHRVVFSETNYRRTLRAAVTSTHKLIHDLGANTFELYDLKADPWEKQNIWGTAEAEAAMATMKGHLDHWLERVFFARDAQTNQAAYKRADVLLDSKPTPKNPADVPLGAGAVAFLGWDSALADQVAGLPVKLVGYFTSVKRTDEGYRARLVLIDAKRQRAAGPTVTLGGDLFDTRRWRPGEFVRQPLTATVPRSWTAGPVQLRLEVTDRRGEKVKLGGQADALLLGTIQVVPLADRALKPVPASTVLGRAGGIEGQYFEGMRFERMKLSRVDRTIKVATTAAPAPGVPKNLFSVRWTGFIHLPRDGQNTVCTESDDGSRIVIGDRRVVDDWSDHSRRRRCGTVLALEGWHPLKVEYYDHGGGAHMQIFVGASKRSARPVKAGELCCTDPETPQESPR